LAIKTKTAAAARTGDHCIGAAADVPGAFVEAEVGPELEEGAPETDPDGVLGLAGEEATGTRGGAGLNAPGAMLSGRGINIHFGFAVIVSKLGIDLQLFLR
jgi:hypothetical protein